jgi:hypothetical protein
LAKGITINGLPMMLGEPSRTDVDIDNLEIYYEDCVTGGPGSFVMTVKDREKLKEAIRTCLFLKLRASRLSARTVRPPEKKSGFPVR